MMRLVSFLLASLALFLANAFAQDDECSCTGLDYTNGGSYLIDGNSEEDFTFTSMFEGCFESTITPILVSPDGDGYECSPLESQPDGVEQASSCPIPYSEMGSGTWTIIIEAPEHNFFAQRQFNLTVGGGDINTVVVTVTPTEYVGVTTTLPGETITRWIAETETEYLEPETVFGDCYLQTDTVFQYLPGPTTTMVSEIERWSTVGVVTQYHGPTTADINTEAYADVVVDKTNESADVYPPANINKQPASSNDKNHNDSNQNVNSFAYRLCYHYHPETYHSVTRRRTTTVSRPTSRITTRITTIPTRRPTTSNDPPRPTVTTRRATRPITTSQITTRITTIPTRRPTTTSRDDPPRTTPRPTTRITTLPTRRPTTSNDRPRPTVITTRRTTPSTAPRPTTRRTTQSPPPAGGIVTTTIRTGRPVEPTSRQGGGNQSTPTSRRGGGGGGQQPTSRQGGGGSQPTPTARRGGEPTSRGSGGGGGGGGGGNQPTSRGGGGRDELEPGPVVTASPDAKVVTARAVARLADVTRTVYETTTVTRTVVEVEEGETATEYNHYTTTWTYTPPAQTVCDAETTETIFYQGPPRTVYQITYVTHYTRATVWVGQTQYTTSTDYPAMTRCWQNGGDYGL
ncbi:hypothetical protein N656DRAFT_802294 [Canariomyces notabilis]|uniref:Uncharacterized protein n=1 Tax=Canariomyces notabilis TaxID=2074819 RepID=A0AAN6T8D3_9PEZI|nr:hypothetical protein N656DRAFT_802294 [Canariomyces arenarius]